MARADLVEHILLRDRVVVLAGLGSIALLSWAYTGYLARSMADTMAGPIAGMGMEMAMPVIRPWGPSDYLLMFVMWTVMMIAMMTPSAAPMVLTYARINRQHQIDSKPVWGTAIFYAGYILMWTAFSAAATLAQGALHAAALLSPMMATSSPVLGGSVLLAAGAFQFSPLKHACLSHCRTPLGFFMTEWREGQWGILMMGLRHGIFCTGCCWLIMALLFVAGVMNLFWITVISAYVLAEKVLPGGHKLSRAIGVLMIGWGAWVVLSALL